MCIIHFECPLFDVFFSSFQTAIIFYIKRSFYYVLTSLKLSLNHASIVWFSAYKKIPVILGFGLYQKIRLIMVEVTGLEPAASTSRT